MSVLAAGSFCFAVLTSPISEDALKHVLKEEMFQRAEIKNLNVKSRRFDFYKLEWTFELTANLDKFWGLPIKVQNLSMEGTKKLFRDSEIKRAVLRFDESGKLFRGGLVLHKDSDGRVVWDLSNLDLSVGSLEKRIGTAAFLYIESINDTHIKANVVFDHLKIPLEITHSEKSVVLQIPKTTLKTQKQKLPFKMLSDIPSTGEWTFASRIEMTEDIYSEASSVEVSKALLSLANVDTSFLRNGRGVAEFSAKITSSENFLNGKVDLNLDKATFELNKGRYFKPDGVPFALNVQVEHNKAHIKIESLKSSLSAQVAQNGEIEAQVKNFDVAIVPDTEKILEQSIRGVVSGKLNASLLKGPLGEHAFELNSLQLSDAQLALEDFATPLFKTKGPSTYKGKLHHSDKQKSLEGVFDFSAAEFSVENAYDKNKEEELKVKIKAQYEDKVWKTFELETSLAGQFIRAKGNKDSITLKIPNTYKNQGGSLLSGSLSYDLCGGSICDISNPRDYSLKLSDYKSTLGFLEDIKISGTLSKEGDVFDFSSLILRWPQGDSLTLEGTLEKYKTADLKVRGEINDKNFSTSNPFLFFKEMPLQKANLDIKIAVNKDNDVWTFSGPSKLENKKISFDKLSIDQSSKNKFLGHAQIDLEPYLYRNEATTFTATLKNTGSLSAFEGLLMRGTYAANLVLATSGLNLGEYISRMSLRASGDAIVSQLPVTLLISQGLSSYAKEKQKAAANKLAKCYPKKMSGKFDFDYNQGRWNLSPSAFQGSDQDSFVKIQGVLGDLSSVNLISHYLPGPKCAAELAACLGDAFPKGGMSFEITGSFKDPETDLDFAFIDQSLERCREIEARREVATENTIDTRDQNQRIQELKNFYRSRKLTR